MKSLQSELCDSQAARGPLAVEAGEHFRQIARNHALWRHPFVKLCRAGRLTLPQVRVLGAQMYQFCHAFPCFLASALATCRADDARLVIGENLWEELGEGDSERAHSALFRRFTRAIGMTDEQLAAVRVEPETKALIDAYRNLSDAFGALGILGALCYASEGIVAALYSHIQKGLRQAGPFDAGALEFFEVHVHVDGGHADKLESVLMPMLRTPEDVRRVELAIRIALDARCCFFDGVLSAAAGARDRT